MELRHIRYFLAVAEEGNFTRAAEKLGMQQPPLSQQIKELERLVGASLFHRLPRGAELTEAGRAFQGEVQPVLAQLERAQRQAQYAARGETGELRIGFTGAAGINPQVQHAIRTFRRSYPQVRLLLDERNTNALLKKLADHELDAVYMRPVPEHAQTFQVIPVSEEPLVAVLPSDHAAVTAGVLDLACLKDEPFILTPREVGPSIYDIIMEACQRAGFTPIIGQVAPQMLSVVSLVAAGLGVSLVTSTMRHLHLEGCTYCDLGPSGPTTHLALALRKLERSPVVRNFRDIATGAG